MKDTLKQKLGVPIVVMNLPYEQIAGEALGSCFVFGDSTVVRPKRPLLGHLDQLYKNKP